MRLFGLVDLWALNFQYNLLSLKEVVAEDSFLGLDGASSNCSGRRKRSGPEPLSSESGRESAKYEFETYDDCKTRLYIEHLKQECGCLPLSLRLSEKVKYDVL